MESNQLRPIQQPLYDIENLPLNGLQYFAVPGEVGFLLKEYKDGKLVREDKFTGEKYAAYLAGEL